MTRNIVCKLYRNLTLDTALQLAAAAGLAALLLTRPAPAEKAPPLVVEVGSALEERALTEHEAALLAKWSAAQEAFWRADGAGRIEAREVEARSARARPR